MPQFVCFFGLNYASILSRRSKYVKHSYKTKNRSGPAKGQGQTHWES